MRNRKNKGIEEINVIKRRLLDDLLILKRQRSTLPGGELVRTDSLSLELERCIAFRFRQLLALPGKSATAANPMKWARAHLVEVLQSVPDLPETVQIFERVYDEELLRASAGATESSSIQDRGGQQLTKRQQAMLAITELWRAHPEATYKKIIELADAPAAKVPTPWPDCPTWAVAMARRQGAVETLLAKARRAATMA